MRLWVRNVFPLGGRADRLGALSSVEVRPGSVHDSPPLQFLRALSTTSPINP